MSSRQIFIISDLHLGGAPPDPTSNDAQKQRGFRMMKHPDKLADFIDLLTARPANETELVINGDFVDFLAEETAPNTWVSFRSAPGAARDALQTIVERDVEGGDAVVFQSLKKFVSSGHKLTVLVGNHDIELALPDVRAYLDTYLGGDVHWLIDSEAYTIGDALIEHGNAYDLANAVDHAGLRLVRALRTRRRAESGDFKAPLGSELVVKIMNPFKRRYAFVDLLKPESEPLFALILAIAPDMRGELKKLLALAPPAVEKLLPVKGVPAQLKNVSATAPPATTAAPDALRDFIGPTLDDAALDELAGPATTMTTTAATAATAPAAATLANVSATGYTKLVWSVLTDDSAPLSDSRLNTLRKAFSELDDDKTWEEGTETGGQYFAAAKLLMEPSPYGPGFKIVVFGHTHHAKRIEIQGKPGFVYLNSGTWANLMKFPKLPADRAAAMTALKEFVGTVEKNELAGEFMPTYVRLDVDVDVAGKHAERSEAIIKVTSARLCPYDFANKKLAD